MKAGSVSEIVLLCPPSLRSSMTELAPSFERKSGGKVAIAWHLMPAMKRLIDGGAAFDVAILTPGLIDDAIEAGAITAESRTPFARTGIGMAVRRGAASPDIATADGVRRALLAARSIAYTRDGAAGLSVLAMIERMGIARDIASKLHAMPGGGAVTPVARGDIELAVTTIPGILEVAGVDLVGPLPAELQSYVVYVAGLATHARATTAARDFIAFLTSPEAAVVFRAKGLQPFDG